MRSALACVRWNTQHLKLNLHQSTRIVHITVITVVMVAVSASGPTGCLVSPPPLSSQNVQWHEKKRKPYRGETPIKNLALGTNLVGKEKLKGKASRIQSGRIVSSRSPRDLCSLLVSWLLYPHTHRLHCKSSSLDPNHIITSKNSRP